MTTEDNLKTLEEKINPNSDVKEGMGHLFKDEIDLLNSRHSIDLRTRLSKSSVHGMSAINFLETVKMKECNNMSLAEGLQVLAVSHKRHSLSLKGLSREELIKLFQADLTSKQPVNNFLSPIK